MLSQWKNIVYGCHEKLRITQMAERNERYHRLTMIVVRNLNGNL